MEFPKGSPVATLELPGIALPSWSGWTWTLSPKDPPSFVSRCWLDLFLPEPPPAAAIHLLFRSRRKVWTKPNRDGGSQVLHIGPSPPEPISIAKDLAGFVPSLSPSDVGFYLRILCKCISRQSSPTKRVVEFDEEELNVVGK